MDNTSQIEQCVEDAAAISTAEELRSYIHHVLCIRENLLEDQFGMTEIELTRNGERCGAEFCLHGPRNLKLSAIWAADHHDIYFYGAKGERFLKVKLPHRIAW